jgi:hypothetical protein
MVYFKVPPTPEQINEALDTIISSKQPIMLLGGGVLPADAHEKFIAVADPLPLSQCADKFFSRFITDFLRHRPPSLAFDFSNVILNNDWR